MTATGGVELQVPWQKEIECSSSGYKGMIKYDTLNPELFKPRRLKAATY